MEKAFFNEEAKTQNTKFQSSTRSSFQLMLLALAGRAAHIWKLISLFLYFIITEYFSLVNFYDDCTHKACLRIWRAWPDYFNVKYRHVNCCATTHQHYLFSCVGNSFLAGETGINNSRVESLIGDGI